MASKNSTDWSWLLISQLYLANAASGAIQVLSGEHAGFYALLELFIAAVAAWWVVSDARSRSLAMSVPRLVVMVLWPVVVPLYLIWSRGWRGLAWVVVHCIGLTTAMWLGYFVALYTTNASADP